MDGVQANYKTEEDTFIVEEVSVWTMEEDTRKKNWTLLHKFQH